MSISSIVPSLSLGGWPLFITAILGSFGLGGLLKTWLDYRGRSRKQTDDFATTMVASMTTRVATVERHAILCEANLAAMRHRVNNLAGSFDGFLLLVEAAPDRALEFVDIIKKKRVTDAHAEAVERAEIMRAALAATGEHIEEEDPAP